MLLNTVTFVLVGLIACQVSFARRVRDAADQKFTKCCEKKELPCVDDCFYKGANKSVTFGELGGECFGGPHFEDWVHCATGPTDNTDCCKKAGVTDLCLELCDGTHPLSVKEAWKFLECGAKFHASIYQCDHDANNN